MFKHLFRAKILDASKLMPTYIVEKLLYLQDYSAMNRAVSQMASSIEKKRGLRAPTQKIADMPFYDEVYSANYKQPRQLIHIQSFTMEQNILDSYTRKSKIGCNRRCNGWICLF